jgi:signal transduction histidine kinase
MLERMRANAQALATTLARAQAEIQERERTERALRDTERELRRAIGEQKRIEELLIAARLKAEETNRLKDEFLAMVSHELRTPLNAILGWAALIRGNVLTPARTGHAIDVIERNARHQAQLVGDLLDVARSLSGRLHLEADGVNLVAIAESAAHSLRDVATARDVGIRVIAGAGAVPVWGDERRLHQVAWNLISNGVKFTPAGGLVEIVVAQVNGCARMTISDTGAGIAAEFLPHVFERFSQADRGSTRMHGGLGLGLTLVRQIIELHRGSIKVESEGLSKGTRFTVLLPLHYSPVDPDDLPKIDSFTPVAQPVRLRSRGSPQRG